MTSVIFCFHMLMSFAREDFVKQMTNQIMLRNRSYICGRWVDGSTGLRFLSGVILAKIKYNWRQNGSTR